MAKWQVLLPCVLIALILHEQGFLQHSSLKWFEWVK